MAKPDFQRVAALALNSVRNVLEAWVPGGKYQGAEYVALNPTRSDSKPGSFTININTGAWSDFATGDKGGDLVALVAYLDGVKQGEACKRLAHWLGLDDPGKTAKAEARAPAASSKRDQGSAWTPILPVPAEALPSCFTEHKQLGTPSAWWEYLDSNGVLLLKVARFDFKGAANGARDKTYRPLMYGRDAAGKLSWRWVLPLERRPLYGLDRLAAADASAPVLLCEGEKSADHAARLFPGAVAMAWPGGAKATDKADFAPLAGRQVWYWPDNDGPGRESVPVLTRMLRAAKVAGLSLVDVSLFGRHRPGEHNGKPALLDAQDAWPEHADAADAVGMGWTAEHVDLLKPLGLLVQPAASEAASTGASLPSGRFRCTADALEYFDTKTESYRRIGAPLAILARSRNLDGSNWGALVAFADRDGKRKEWAVPDALLVKEGGVAVRERLVSLGYALEPTRDARGKLLEFLASHEPGKRVYLVDRTGWEGDAFVLPDRIIGAPKEELRFSSEALELCKMARRGTLEGWRDAVAQHCLHSSRLSFAVAAAFAAPLLGVLGMETTGFHFVGNSSIGKTTLLKVASSVYGNPSEYARTWLTTGNALESTAAAHNGCLLVLDEVHQIDSRVIGETVYMLSQGRGKSRATETGSGRGVVHRWQLLFLSSGERTLLDHMAEANKKTQAGMEVRMLAIPATPHGDSAKRQALGIFESAGDFTGGAAISAHLVKQAAQHHGVVLVKWLEFLTGVNRKELAQQLRDMHEAIVGERLTAGGGQTHRAADKFALVAAAGELATRQGLTGWPEGWASDAAESCFNAWLALRGGSGNLEDQRTLEQIQRQLQLYGESRFTRWDKDGSTADDHGPRTLERWGFRRKEGKWEADGSDVLFYMLREGFQELCKGLDYKHAARLLRDHGALVTDNGENRYTYRTRLPDHGKALHRCYVIRLSALAAIGCAEGEADSDGDA